ncbi:MAG TPA: hypothetical protein VJG29_00605 [Candidatus Paceibacterota bacterium]
MYAYKHSKLFRTVSLILVILIVTTPLYVATPAEAGGGGGGIGGFVKSFTKSFTTGKGIAAMLIGLAVSFMLPAMGPVVFMEGAFAGVGSIPAFTFSISTTLGQSIGGAIAQFAAGKILGGDKKDVGPAASVASAEGTDITEEGASQMSLSAGSQLSTNCTFVVRPLVVTRGEDAAAGWSCTSSGSSGIGFSIPNGIASGTEPIEQPQRTASYGVMCSDGCQTTAILKVDEPNISISAAPDLVNPGDTTTITWSGTTNLGEDATAEEIAAATCSVTGPGFSQSGLSGGAQTGPIENESLFTLVCGSLSESAIVRLIPSFENL